METNPRDQVKLISTDIADLSKIRRIGPGPYVVSVPQHRNIFFEIIHFPSFNKALVDPGASVSVMPFPTYTNLDLEILSRTRLTIELADRTIKQPRGIAENVLVRIGRFVFPIDFIILDIPEDNDVPLILGRPFLSTAHAKIDVFKRKVTTKELAVNEIDLMVQDYALWEVIENDNSFKPVARVTANADGTSSSNIPGPVTTKEKAQKRIFGGNDAIKKTQKTLLKQMYENFNAPNTESLDSIFNRLQEIVS
ncbi:retrovirus-related pol polyprotein from transposon TNT 1-94 [Tanacetum coccineum]